MAELVVVRGDIADQSISLRDEPVLIGRHPSCDVELRSRNASRRHAQVHRDGDHYVLEDLKSNNGTYLNGQRIEGQASLNEGDEITICGFVFRFSSGSSSGTSAAKTKQAVVAPTEGGLAEDRSASLLDDDPFAATLPPGSMPADDDSWEVNARLSATSLDVTRMGVKAEDKLKVMMEICRKLGAIVVLDDVLEELLELLFRVFLPADLGFLLLVHAEKGVPVTKAIKSRRAGDDESARPSMTIVRQAIADGEAILSADASSDDRFSGSASIQFQQVRSMICAPLIGASGESLGAIQLVAHHLDNRFTEEDLELLVSVASQASLAVENAHLHESKVQQGVLQRELAFARQLQLDFLPQECPSVSGYAFHHVYRAARNVGGDYFDYVDLPDGRLAVTVADVAGKGVPAAMLMAKYHSRVRSRLLTEKDLSEAINGLNAEICASLTDYPFISCIVVLIDPKTHTVSVCNAGHPPMLHVKTDSSVTEVGQATGPPLGIDAQATFDTTHIEVSPGESMIMFTDGVTEALSANDEVYGNERLFDCLSKGSDGIEALVQGLLADVESFCTASEQSDDICIVGFQRVPLDPRGEKQTA